MAGTIVSRTIFPATVSYGRGRDHQLSVHEVEKVGGVLSGHLSTFPTSVASVPAELPRELRSPCRETSMSMYTEPI